MAIGSAKVNSIWASRPCADWSFQYRSVPSMRFEHPKFSLSSLEQVTEIGMNCSGAAAPLVVVVVLVSWALGSSSPPKRALKPQARSATTATATRITASARAPAVVRIIGWGATGSGPWAILAPHSSQ